MMPAWFARHLVLLAFCCGLVHGQVKYGRVIALRHPESGKRLYSSATMATHPGSSMQNQVVGVQFSDSSCYWRVLPGAGTDLSAVEGQDVRDADVIRLLHVNTERFLHSHSGFASAVTNRQEVTGFNDPDSVDDNDNWIVRVLAPTPGQAWGMHSVRLMHQRTRAKLFSEPEKVHANYTSGYQEVCASIVEPEPLQGNYEWAPEAVQQCSGSDSCGAGGGEEDETIKAFNDANIYKMLSLFRAWDEERFKQLNDDPNNTPKEISIYCPQNPNVDIQDLDYSLQAEGTCLVLNIQSPHLEGKLMLKCGNKGEKSSDSEEDKTADSD